MNVIIKNIYIFIVRDIVGSMRLIPLRFLENFGQLFPENRFGCKIRGSFYKPFLKSCGKNFQVGLRVKLQCLDRIEVGNDVYIGDGSWVNGYKDGIILKDEVMLGPYVTMVAGNHGKIKDSYRFGSGTGGTITIGVGSWLAAKSTIVAGVSVGKGVLVAANTVVTKDVKDNDKIAGIPAKSLIK